MNHEPKPTRRDFVTTAAAGAGSLALSATAFAADPLKETLMSSAPAFQSSETLKPLPFGLRVVLEAAKIGRSLSDVLEDILCQLFGWSGGSLRSWPPT